MRTLRPSVHPSSRSPPRNAVTRRWASRSFSLNPVSTPMTVTEDEYYEQHAALLGHVTLAWNDCHSIVLSIFHSLAGVSWEKAYAIFLALKSDHARREITLALMNEVLNTK